MIPRGTVQKLERNPFRVVHLARTAALFEGAEWWWSDAAGDAYIFETFELAEAAAKRLEIEGDGHVHAIVYGAQSEAMRNERQARRRDREAHAEPVWTEEDRIAEHQRNLERMHLA